MCRAAAGDDDAVCCCNILAACFCPCILLASCCGGIVSKGAGKSFRKSALVCEDHADDDCCVLFALTPNFCSFIWWWWVIMLYAIWAGTFGCQQLKKSTREKALQTSNVCTFSQQRWRHCWSGFTLLAKLCVFLHYLDDLCRRRIMM